MDKLTSFLFNGDSRPVKFSKTEQEADGVVCDEYFFVGDNSMDLGIYKFEPGKRLPRRLVLGGIETIEEYISGKGWLLIWRSGGGTESYSLGFTGAALNLRKVLHVDDEYRWIAADGCELEVSEVCIPSYAKGRFEDMP